jgi:hypothetical protein
MGFDSRTVELRASRYTNDTIPAHGEQMGYVSLSEIISQVIINLMP